MNKIIRLLNRLTKNKSIKHRIVLDTCILIDYFDGTGEISCIKRIFNLLDEEAIEGFISVVTIAEIIKHLSDLEESGTVSNSSITEIMESIEDNFFIIPLEHEIAREAGIIKHKSSSKKRPLSYNDAFIASTAKSLTAPLITCDGEFFMDRLHKLNSRIEEIHILTPDDFMMGIGRMVKE